MSHKNHFLTPWTCRSLRFTEVRWLGQRYRVAAGLWRGQKHAEPVWDTGNITMNKKEFCHKRRASKFIWVGCHIGSQMAITNDPQVACQQPQEAVARFTFSENRRDTGELNCCSPHRRLVPAPLLPAAPWVLGDGRPSIKRGCDLHVVIHRSHWQAADSCSPLQWALLTVNVGLPIAATVCLCQLGRSLLES